MSTIVTITENELRAYHHAGKTGICIAVSAIVQTAARVLLHGKALEAVELCTEPPLYVVRAAIGDFGDETVPLDERVRIGRERSGRRAFVRAVFDGVVQTLEEIAETSSGALEVKDQRHIPLASRKEAVSA